MLTTSACGPTSSTPTRARKLAQAKLHQANVLATTAGPRAASRAQARVSEVRWFQRRERSKRELEAAQARQDADNTRNAVAAARAALQQQQPAHEEASDALTAHSSLQRDAELDDAARQAETVWEARQEREHRVRKPQHRVSSWLAALPQAPEHAGAASPAARR